MAGAFIGDAEIARARQLAHEITTPVLEVIRRHTTVSIERTVLRLLGISGAGPRGVPLVNVMVDRLKDAGVINRGAAYWFGRALRMGARSPSEAVERIVALPADKLTTPAPQEDAAIREELRREVAAAVSELRARIELRDSLERELGMSPPPH